jgi:ferrochelatase
MGAARVTNALPPETGVLLLNMGGPETLAEVRPFLFRLFRDPDILPLPRWLRGLSWPLALLISTLRARRSRHAYARIGGGSPLRRTNEAVAAKLRERLDAPVAVAMRYWRPFTDTALDALEAAGVKSIVALPMYPQYSTTTTMSSYRELHRCLALRADRWRPRVRAVLDYHLDARYLDAVAARVRAALAQMTTAPRVVLMSAHSIPRQIEAFCGALMQRLPPGTRWALGYQSRVGPVEWVGPQTPAVIERLAAEGVRGLAVVPVSFVSEHVETLEEIELQYGALARARGIVEFVRVPTVCADDDFVDFLAALAREQASGAPAAPCRREVDACVCISGSST